MSIKYSQKEIRTFLRESNKIEAVWDEDSLLQATYAWEYLRKQNKLNHTAIFKTHKILMLHQPIAPNQKGYYRTVPVWIGGREGMEPGNVEGSMDQWIINANDLIVNGKNEPEQYLLDLTQKQHIIFENIHPFIDGNGRTGRLLMLWEREKLNLPIQIIYEKDKQDYYNWFK